MQQKKYGDDTKENKIEQNEVAKEVNSSTNEFSNIGENLSSTDTSTNIDQAEGTKQNDIDKNYYANSKLERDKMYAEMITGYENIINNINSSEAQKSIATQEITKINNTKNAIMICENLILTKGFENCVILINEKSVNIVVKTEGGLNTEKTAKIQNIISRELNTEIENIHITEK